jgi:hypothetical protein
MRSDSSLDDEQVIAKGGVACPFPWRLHEMLEAATREGMEDIVSWQPHGRSFTVYKPKEFVGKILQRYVCLLLLLMSDSKRKERKSRTPLWFGFEGVT